MEYAIYTDCRTIIRNFVHNGSASFESFSMQWKAMMFHHIYSAQSSTTEVLQTTTAVLHVAKRLLCNKDGSDELTLQRIGALYLLYAIYFKQPTRQYIKIDVTLNGWQQMIKFINKLADNKAFDEARYVFWALHEMNAFRFCAHDFHLGLENLVDYDMVMNKSGHDNDSSQQHSNVLLEDLMDFSDVRGMLPALTTLEDGYNEMKELLVKEQEQSGAMIGGRVLPATNIFKDIQQVFGNIRDILDVEERIKKPDDNQKNSRRDLKRKGYEVRQTKQGLKIESALNGRREITLSRGVHRMSAKTVFAEILPDETLQDLQGDDDVDPHDEDYDDQDGDISAQEEFIAN